MRKAVGPNIGVKASGGISNYKDTLALLEAEVPAQLAIIIYAGLEQVSP